MPILETVNLTRRFGELTAVDDLTLTVEPGEVFGLVGPNGAGKSTVIKMLTTLLPPTSGRAAVGGYDEISKKVLILDPDRKWYEPYWAPEDTVFEAVADSRSDSEQPGYIYFKP